MFGQRENSGVKTLLVLCLLVSTYLCLLDAIHLLPDDAWISTGDSSCDSCGRGSDTVYTGEPPHITPEHCCCQDVNCRMNRHRVELIRRHGYPAESRIATTEDGYRLEVHRLPQRVQSSRVILLVHGLGGSSSDYVIMGPKRSLAYLLWDAGYDVWIGNLRGNAFTSHAYLKTDNPLYWNYSFHEHGKYDVPAMIDKVLEVTKSPRLFYTGYSMGTNSFFVMMSERPEYNNKVIAFVGLAPALYIDAQHKIASLTYDMGIIEKFWHKGIYALRAPQPVLDATIGTFCRARKPSDDICMRIFYIYVGEDYEQTDWELTPTILARFQPFAMKQIKHFQHTAITGVFGPLSKNLNQTKPYNFSAVRVPVSIFYGENDQLTDKNSVQRLTRELKQAGDNTVLLSRVGWPKFNHLDFVYAKDLGKLLNIDLVRHINKLYQLYN